MRKGDRIAGIIIVILGILVLLYSYSFQNTNVGYVDASFFPKIMGILFILTGSILVINTVKKNTYKNDEKIILHKKESMMILLYFIYIILMPFVGFIITTPLLIIILTYLLGFRKIYVNFAIGILVTVGIYILFRELLSVPLPSGILF